MPPDVLITPSPAGIVELFSSTSSHHNGTLTTFETGSLLIVSFSTFITPNQFVSLILCQGQPLMERSVALRASLTAPAELPTLQSRPGRGALRATRVVAEVPRPRDGVQVVLKVVMGWVMKY